MYFQGLWKFDKALSFKVAPSMMEDFASLSEVSIFFLSWCFASLCLPTLEVPRHTFPPILPLSALDLELFYPSIVLCFFHLLSDRVLFRSKLFLCVDI